MPCRRSSAKSRMVSRGIATMTAIQNAGLPEMYVFIGSRSDDSSLRGAESMSTRSQKLKAAIN